MPSAWKKDAAVSAEDILSSVKRRVKFDDDGNAESVVSEDAESVIEDDSEDEEEDEEGEELTPALDAAIMRTLAMIRKKDEGVYGSGNVLEEQLRRAEVEAQKLKLSDKKDKGKEKAFSLQDHQRIALLEGKLANPDEEDSPQNLPETIIPLTHVQEERALRAEVTKAFHTAIGEDEDQEEDDDGFLVKRDRTDTEKDEEKEAYRKFLLANGGGEDEVRKLLGLGGEEDADVDGDEEIADDGEDVASKAQVDVRDANHQVVARTEKSAREKKDDDAFLMNYILNRGWIDSEDQPEASTSAPVLKPAGKKGQAEGSTSTSHPWGELEDDEAFDEIAETFETAYNFRFEEPGAANIVSHPREIASAARREDDTRKLKRQAKAERKAAEKAKREEETKRLKGQKRRDIEKQLAVLKAEFGEDALEGLDLEGDWDEAKHEAALQKLIGAEEDDRVDEFVDDRFLSVEQEKPTWDDDGEGPDQVFEELEPLDEMEAGEDYPLPENDDDDAPLNMDADFLEVPDGEGNKKKKNKKNKKKEKRRLPLEEDAMDEASVEANLGLSLEERKAKLKDAVDEYQNLDHEDMIGDLPTRFKYMKAAPNTYGLTPVEILLATDAELNDFLTVKHYAPYRHGSGVGAAGRGMGKRLGELKSKLATRRWGEEIEVDAKGFGKDADQARSRDSGWKKRDNNGGFAKDSDAVPSGPPKKRMGKKERQRLKATATTGNPTSDSVASQPTEKKRKHADGEHDSTKRQKV
ncbi:hypothetical protein QFC19_008013 [Naganishia cerealis]|uniref:Uncharacterized protein n=1 Tax=Naganishia cerealis TaxID=610337 RepID=A0ACC2V500_9TREE|nr:hypothetical protein QFC19_008013 [Naganishia cerealis]